MEKTPAISHDRLQVYKQ
jgi:hypothetical protein